MSHFRRCVIGIDGGASSTRAALIGEDLSVLVEGRGGPADHFSAVEGKERLASSLAEATSPLLASLEATPNMALVGVCLGLTGVTIPGKRRAAEGVLAGMFPGARILVESDTVSAWAGAFAGQDGVIVIAGTGSVAYGRRGGREARKGGFGYLFGDEGGSFRIASEAVSAALRDHDGLGPATSLTGVVRDFFGAESVRQVPGKVYSESVPVEAIASLCPLVVKEAERGDEVARRILTAAGHSLGKLAAATLKALGGEACRVSYAGGVWRAGEPVLEPFREAIAGDAPGARVSLPEHSPLIGAGILAWGRARPSGLLPEVRSSGPGGNPIDPA